MNRAHFSRTPSPHSAAQKSAQGGSRCQVGADPSPEIKKFSQNDFWSLIVCVMPAEPRFVVREPEQHFNGDAFDHTAQGRQRREVKNDMRALRRAPLPTIVKKMISQITFYWPIKAVLMHFYWSRDAGAASIRRKTHHMPSQNNRF